MAVSLKGKKAVGNWLDMDSSILVVLAIVPAEIIDLDILGVEVITLARPLGDVILTMWRMTRDEALSQDETFTGTLARARSVEVFLISRVPVVFALRVLADWPVANTYMESGSGLLISPSHLSINDIRDHNVLITLFSPLLALGWGSLREFSP